MFGLCRLRLWINKWFFGDYCKLLQILLNTLTAVAIKVVRTLRVAYSGTHPGVAPARPCVALGLYQAQLWLALPINGLTKMVYLNEQCYVCFTAQKLKFDYFFFISFKFSFGAVSGHLVHIYRVLSKFAIFSILIVNQVGLQ